MTGPALSSYPDGSDAWTVTVEITDAVSATTGFVSVDVFAICGAQP